MLLQTTVLLWNILLPSSSLPSSGLRKEKQISGGKKKKTRYNIFDMFVVVSPLIRENPSTRIDQLQQIFIYREMYIFHMVTSIGLTLLLAGLLGSLLDLRRLPSYPPSPSNMPTTFSNEALPSMRHSFLDHWRLPELLMRTWNITLEPSCSTSRKCIDWPLFIYIADFDNCIHLFGYNKIMTGRI